MPETAPDIQPITDAEAVKRFSEMEKPPREKEAAKSEPAPEGDDQPEEESEPEEEEAEPEEEETDEEPEEDDGESEVAVKIDGKTQRIKLKDLRDGYLRTSDYTRKTQQLAEQRKAAEGELSQTREQREHYRAMLGHLAQQMDALMPQEPDWNAYLQQNGTDAFLRTKLQWDSAMKNRQAVEAERQHLEEQAQAEAAQAHEATLTEERGRMLETIPEWKDPKRMTKERDEIVKWAKKYFTDEDLNQVTDHRAVHMLRLAWLGDKMLRAKATLRPAPEPEEVKPARPLSPAVRSSSASGFAAAKDRLAKTGNDDDAVSVFEQFEKNLSRRRAG